MPDDVSRAALLFLRKGERIIRRFRIIILIIIGISFTYGFKSVQAML